MKIKNLIQCVYLIFLFLLSSTAQAAVYETNKLQIVITPDGYPIIWYDSQKYGVDFTFVSTQVLSCTGACMVDAANAGAAYYRVYQIDQWVAVTAYYDASGKVLGTSKVDNTPPLPATNTNSVSSGTTTVDNSLQNVTTSDYVGNTLVQAEVAKDGSAQFTIPLVLPPGSNGQAPNLDIVYNSRKPNGLIGQGAGISSLSSVARCPAKVILDGFSSTINFDANDRFCLDGQRLIAVTGTYGANGTEYRTEIDSFARIYSRGAAGFGPAYFEVETKSGDFIQYGATTDSAIKAAGRTDIKRWAISKNTDRAGNYIEYRYAGASNSSSTCTVSGLQTGEYVPCRIDYTGNAAAVPVQSPFASVIFTYETRPDVQSGYVGGTVETRSKRIANISTYRENVLVKSYKMTYKSNTANNTSQLTDVQECDASVVASCKRPVHINWTNTSLKPIAANQIQQARDSLSVNNTLQINSDGVKISPSGNNNAINGDFNADGMTDILLLGLDGKTNKFCSGPGLTLSNNCISLSLTGVSSTKGASIQNGDYNGDGIVDFYIIGSTANSSYFCPGPVNVPAGGAASMSCKSSPLTNPLAYSSTRNPYVAGPYGQVTTVYTYVPTYKVNTTDINGDGHDDLLFLALGTSGAWLTGSGYETYAPRTSFLCTDASLGGQSYYKSSLHSPVTGGGCTTINSSKNSAWAVSGTISAALFPDTVAFAPLISDFNGDGNQDLFLIRASTNSLFCKGSPQGLVDACVSVPSGGWSSATGFGRGSPVGDFNGDGYADFFFLKYNIDVMTTTGIFCPGPVGISNYNNCVSTVNFPTAVVMTVPADFNGDGRADVFAQSLTKQYFCDSSVLVSGGSCIDVTSTIIPITQQQLTYGGGSSVTTSSYINLGIFPGDYNGDGNTDLYMAGPSSSFFAEGIDSGKSVSKVTDSIGQVSSFDYTTLANPDIYTAGNGSSSTGVTLHIPMQVVSKYKVSNAAESLNEYAYSYTGAMFNVYRGYLGFTSRTVTEAQKNIKTTESYYQTYPFIGQTASQTVNKVSGQVISKTTNNYLSVATNSGKTIFPYPQSQTTEAYDLNTGTKYATTAVTNSVDDFGNLTNQIKTVTDNLTAESFATTTVNTYANKTSTTWRIKGLLTRADETKSGSQGTSPTISRALEYDNGVPNKGLLTKDTIASGTTNELNKSYAYDAFGNKVTEILSPLASMATTHTAYFAPRTTTITYDAKGRFPATRKNSLNQIETYTYNANFGVRTDVVAADMTTTHWDYDTFGQQTAMLRPDGTKQTLQRQWDTATHIENMLSGVGGNGHQSRYKITTHDYAKDGVTEFLAPVTNIYNTTGNVIRVVTQGFDGGDIYTDANYDEIGRKFAASRAYYATDITNKHPTHIQYDELDRVVQTDDPAGVITTNSYNGLITTTNKAFDGKNQSTVTTLNALGQPKSVTDANLKNLSYTYANTTTGRIDRIVDPANNTVEMEYDTLDRKVRMQDPDMGTWTYGYNALGEQKWLKSPKNSLYTNLFEYDALGRATKRTDYKDNGSVENVSTWTYDTLVPGKLSAIATTTTDAFNRSFAYDTLKRVSSITSRILSTDYAVTYGYDANDGRVKTVKYPSGFEVKNNFNNHGYLNQVVNAASPSTVYWQGNATTADGQFSNVDYGNGVNSIRGYKLESGRLDFINAAKSGTTLQHNSYAFDGIGNLLSRNDMLNNHVETFSYDALNRLQTNSLDGAAVTTLVYSDLGNITTLPGVGTYTYKTTTTRPHAVESITGALNSNFTYDANGNMQSGNNRSIIWTSFDKPRQITRTNNSSVYASFAYDADFNRTVQTTNIGQTVYLNPETTAGAHYEKHTATGSIVPENRHYIYAGDNLVAMYATKTGVADNTKYFLKDHLGSTEVITNNAGQVVERLSYAAFGNRRMATSWLSSATPIVAQSTTRGYTGHEQLDDLGLVNMNGRFYDPQIGRFISADPFIQSPDNLQSFNRYSYVMNNPLSFTDPSGYSTVGFEYDSYLDYDYLQTDYYTTSGVDDFSFSDYSYSDFGYSDFSFTNYNLSPLDYGSATTDITLWDTPAGVNYSGGDYFSGLGLQTDVGSSSGAGYGIIDSYLQWRQNNLDNFVRSIMSGDKDASYDLAMGFAFGAAGTVETLGSSISKGIDGKQFALGLSEGLDKFAASLGASTWKTLSDPMNWKTGVLDALKNPNIQVHFNLDGVNVWGGVQSAAAGRPGATNWELLQIKENPQFWGSLQFWRNGEPAANPFK